MVEHVLDHVLIINQVDAHGDNVAEEQLMSLDRSRGDRSGAHRTRCLRKSGRDEHRQVLLDKRAVLPMLSQTVDLPPASAPFEEGQVARRASGIQVDSGKAASCCIGLGQKTS
jgi:hypothetical protein